MEQNTLVALVEGAEFLAFDLTGLYIRAEAICMTGLCQSLMPVTARNVMHEISWPNQYLRHGSKTLDFVCAEHRQNQGF